MGGAGKDRAASEYVAEVGGELVDAEVALAGIFAEGLEEDGIDVGVGAFGKLGDGAWFGWELLAHDAEEFGGGELLEGVGRDAGEEQVEQDAERVGVGCRGDGLAHDLLRAGVLRRVGAEAVLREACGGVRGRGLEELGGAEIEQARCAVMGDEDVVRLEVAVDDEVLVGVLDGIADLQKELQAGVKGEFVLAAILRDGDAFDVLEGEVEFAALGDATAEQTRYEGMREEGEDLAFLTEALAEEFARDGDVDELDGNLLVELAVAAVCEVDGAHAAAADEVIELVRPDLSGFAGGFGGGFGGGGVVAVTLFGFAGAQEGAQLIHERGVAFAASFKDGGALGLAYFGDLVKYALCSLPVFFDLIHSTLTNGTLQTNRFYWDCGKHRPNDSNRSCSFGSGHSSDPSRSG